MEPLALGFGAYRRAKGPTMEVKVNPMKTVWCKVCEGDKVVHCEGIGPRRAVGSVSAMEQPDYWDEPCEACNGTGLASEED